MTAIAQTAQSNVATRLLAGVSVPDTALISRAIDFARERSEPYLFNHVMRSWLFAAIVAQRKQIAHFSSVATSQEKLPIAASEASGSSGPRRTGRRARSRAR